MIFLEIQNSRFFCRSVISRSEKSFFKKNFNPLSDIKVDHYSDIKEKYWLGNKWIFLEYISDDRVPRPTVLFTGKKTEMDADAPECRK